MMDVLLDEEARPLVEVGDPFGLRRRHDVLRLFRKFKSVYVCFDLDEEVYNTGQVLFTLVSHAGDRFLIGCSTGVIKIFDSFSVKLACSLDLQAQKIALMILSKDDRFLIVADSKCVIHVFDFRTYKKLSQINNLRNSEVSFMDLLKVDGSSFLVVCTKEHGLWVYRRELFDGTAPGLAFDRGSKLLLPFVHWSCCEISHKEKRINAIDSKGILHSWGDVPGLFDEEKLESESKIIFDNRYRPEIMLVNDSLGLILLYNKNMHFFIRVEANTFLILEEQKYPKINPRMKERGVVVNHNSQFCMVAVNVEKKREGSSGELGLVKSTLFMYEYVSNAKINLIAKVDEDNSEIEMNANIFLIQTHPTFRNVFITGDYEGQLIIWDVSKGVILKVFKEKFYRGPAYSVPNPILEAQFFPNGLQFVIATYYGVVSLFGYGACHNVSLQPNEQFFEKEILMMQNEVEPVEENEGFEGGGREFDIDAIEGNPLILYQTAPSEMRRVQLEEVLDQGNESEEPKVLESAIPLGDLIDLEEEKKSEKIQKSENGNSKIDEKENDSNKEKESEKENIEEVNNAEADKQEIIEASEDDDDDDFPMGELVNDQTLNNLTRGPVHGRTVNRQRPEPAGIKENEPNSKKNSMGYFCNSNLEKHQEWSRDSTRGYFEHYQQYVKKARKRESELLEEYEDQQKLLMDVYFKEQQKTPRRVKVDSEMPLVPHLIDAMGLVYREKPRQAKINTEENDKDCWKSEEEETIGIRPRRRRLREQYREMQLRGEIERNERYTRRRDEESRPQITTRRVMTRSRARELSNEQRMEGSRLKDVQEERVEEDEDSVEEVEICRRRMRTRNMYRLDNIDAMDLGSSRNNGRMSLPEDTEPIGESTIGANAGERRRRNIEKNLSLNGAAVLEISERKNSRDQDLRKSSMLNLNGDTDRANETPGRIITSFDDSINKKKRFCFECSEEIMCRKKKRKCSECSNLFHLGDCSEHGLLSFQGDQVCIHCYFERKKNDRNIQSSAKQGRFKIESINSDPFGNFTRYSLNEERKFLMFELTEGEEIFIIPQMFKSFLKHYSDVLPSDWVGQNLDLLLLLKEDIKASVLDVGFALPQMKTKSLADKFARQGDLPLFQIMKVKIIDSNVNELRTKYNLQPIPDIDRCIMTIPFFIPPNLENLFILPSKAYNFFQEEVKLLNNFSPMCHYLGEPHTISLVNDSPSFYQMVDITPCDTNEILTRQKHKSYIKKAHPQYLFVLIQKFISKNQAKPTPEKEIGSNWDLIASRFESLVERYKEILYYFIEEVDKNIYSDYRSVVEYEMNVNLILNRLKHRFYLSKKAVKKDLIRIVENAKKYNLEDSIIVKFAKFLRRICEKALEGDVSEKDNTEFDQKFEQLKQNDGEVSDSVQEHQDTKIVLTKTHESLKIVTPNQIDANPSLKKRTSSTAFPSKRAPSLRLKKIYRKTSITSREESSPEKKTIHDMIKNPRRRRRQYKLNMVEENSKEQASEQEEGAKQVKGGDDILQQIFENNQAQGESKMKTRRRLRYEMDYTQK